MKNDIQMEDLSNHFPEDMKIIKESFFSTRFEDKIMEDKFQSFSIKNHLKNAIIMFVFSILFLLYRLFCSKMMIEQNFYIVLYLTLLIICFLILSCLIYFKQNMKLRKLLFNLFLIVITFNNIFTTISSHLNYKKIKADLDIKDVDVFLIINILNQSINRDMDLFYFILFILLNFFPLSFIFMISPGVDGIKFKDILYFLITSGIIMVFIKENSIIKRLNFYLGMKIKKEKNFINNLIDKINDIYFKIDNDEIIECNDNFKKIVNSKFCDENELKNLYSSLNKDEKGANNINVSVNGNCNEDNNTDFNKKRKNRTKTQIIKNILSTNGLDNNGNIQNNASKKKKIPCSEYGNNNNIDIKKQKIPQANNILMNKVDYNNSLNINNSLLNLKHENNGFFFYQNQNYEKTSIEEENKDFYKSKLNLKFKVNFDTFKFKKLSESCLDFRWENLQEAIFYIQKNKSLNNFKSENFDCLGEIYLEQTKNNYEVYYKVYVDSSRIDFYFNHINESKLIYQKIENEYDVNYFAKMAHEFKTPLNSIIGLIKNIHDSCFNQVKLNFEKFKSTLRQIENLSKYVIFLINDIIDFSKLNESNKLNLNLEDVNIKQITDFCSDIIQALLINKGKEDKIKVENIFDIKINNHKIISDDFRLKQILLNFISNSVKFTKCGFIKINSEIFTEESRAKSNKLLSHENLNDIKEYNIVKISIIDSGIGIKKEELDKLLKFDDYNMLEEGKKYNKEGSGLGLSITNEIVKQLQHELFIESIQGNGSCFGIKIKAEIIKEPFIKSIYQISKEFSDISNGDNNNIKSSELDYKPSYESRNYSEKYEEILTEFKNFKNFLKIDKTANFLNYRQSSNKYERKFQCSVIDINNNYKCLHLEPPSNQKKLLEHNDDFLVNNLKRKISNKTIYWKNSKEKDDSSFNKETIIIPDSKINFKIKKLSKYSKMFTFNYDTIKNKSFSEIESNLSNDNSIILKNNYPLSPSESSFIIDNTYNKNPNFSSKLKLNLESERQESKGEKIFETLRSNFLVKKSPSKFTHKSNQELEMLKSLKSIIKRELTDNKKIILVVDDNKIIRESLKNMINKILEKSNKDGEFRVKEGDDGSYFIRQIIKDQFDRNKIKCVITDENMEFINGSYAVAILKELEKKNQIKPVIYASFTNHEEEAIKNNLRKNGIDFFIPKLCSEQLLLDFFVKNKIIEI